MKKIVSGIILLTLLLKGDAAAQFPGSQKIDSILSSATRITGPSELIIVKDGKVIYKKNYGGLIPGSYRDKVRTASSSKWLTAATLLALVDEGLISLDDAIGKYLPNFKGDKASITVRQLLSHTSGLPPYSVYLKDASLSLAQSVDSIASRVNLVAEPGTEFSYGGVSYQVAARIAEVTSGKDWESLFNEKIALPCEMHSTDFGNQRAKNIADGAYSTADDFSKFLSMLLNKGKYNGKKVLSTAMVKEMLSDQTGSLPSGYTPYRFKSAKQSGFYGLGIWLDRILVSDSSATEVSSQGAKGFTPWINLCKNLAGVYSFEVELSKAKPYIDETKAIIDFAFPDNCVDMQTEKNPKQDEPLFSLEQNFPNPAVQSTNISFKLEQDAEVSLKLFDPLGNETMTLLNRKMQAGDYTIPVDASKLNAGIYFYRLVVNGRAETKKLTIRK
ncbi:MAG TPA: serine hydrolase [Chitinophagales bacterium]|nr:serine hydrolase [Chitinophagales bacterium]